MFKEWVCVFPGKMGISWKLAHNKIFDNKVDAETEAMNNCNVAAIPLELYRRMAEHEHRMVVAERTLIEETGLRLDYNDGNIVLTNVRGK